MVAAAQRIVVLTGAGNVWFLRFDADADAAVLAVGDVAGRVWVLDPRKPAPSVTTILSQVFFSARSKRSTVFGVAIPSSSRTPPRSLSSARVPSSWLLPALRRCVPSFS